MKNLTDKTELIFGYGSLMSYRGLFREKNTEILDVFRVRIKGRRGFAKPSSSNIICMDIDDFMLKGNTIKIDPQPGSVEGLLIKIKQVNFPKYCRREGYFNGNKLITFSSDYECIGEALWALFQKSIDIDPIQSIKEYRKNLKKAINYTSEHYIPHPLDLGDLGFAITFIAPGKYGTGNASLTSRKEERNISHLLDITDVLKRKFLDKEAFLNYTLDCLYGGVHGINIRDIINLIPKDSEFYKNVQKNLTKETINEEKICFANVIIGNIEFYEEKFGKIDQNLKRSGLNSILNF